MLGIRRFDFWQRSAYLSLPLCPWGMSNTSAADATISIRQTPSSQDGREPVGQVVEDVRKHGSGDNEKRGDKNLSGAKRKDYKGFVAGVFSGITKLAGE